MPIGADAGPPRPHRGCAPGPRRRWLSCADGPLSCHLGVRVPHFVTVAWVKKWVKRFREADPNDPSVVQSRSRARSWSTTSRRRSSGSQSAASGAGRCRTGPLSSACRPKRAVRPHGASSSDSSPVQPWPKKPDSVPARESTMKGRHWGHEVGNPYTYAA